MMIDRGYPRRLRAWCNLLVLQPQLQHFDGLYNLSRRDWKGRTVEITAASKIGSAWLKSKRRQQSKVRSGFFKLFTGCLKLRWS